MQIMVKVSWLSNRYAQDDDYLQVPYARCVKMALKSRT